MDYVNYENLKTAKEMIKVALDKKVDKEDGKGLSTNDYTNEEKTKLAGIEEEANKTIVDSELSLESSNPIENKVVSEALNTKADTVEVDEALNTKVDKESGKGLSTNDFTTEEKEKLAKLNEKANENTIEVITQNGQVLENIDKSVNIVVPTDTSELTNNAGYQTATDVTDKIASAMKDIDVDIDLSSYATKSEIPTAVSQLTNDEGFITSYIESDPTVPAHVKAITEADIANWNNGTGSGSGDGSCNVIVSATEPTTGEAVWIQTGGGNLFNKETAIEGGRLYSNGNVITYTNNSYASDFVEVEPNTQYTLSGCTQDSGVTIPYYNCYYDADKQVIDYYKVKAGTHTITTPSNAYYMRFTVYTVDLDTFQFEKGTVATSYKEYGIGKNAIYLKDSDSYNEFINIDDIPSKSDIPDAYTLPPATATTLGGIKVGDNLTIDADGTLHAQAGGSGGENIETDTKWVDLALSEDFVLYTDSSYCRCAKNGNVVNVQFEIKPTSDSNALNSASKTYAFTLPEGYRPGMTISTICQGSGTNIFLVNIYDSGEVYLSRYRNSSTYASNPPGTSTWLPGNIAFMVDEGYVITNSGNVDLTNYVTKDELPTNLSEFNNDSGYINQIKTINGQSLEGTGNIVIVGNGDGSGGGLPEVSVGVDTPVMGESIWIQTRENLFNKNTITPDLYINDAGELATHASWNVSDYIPVEPGVNYTWRNVNSYGSAAYFGYYDADKTLVSLIKQEIGENTIIIPDGACYIRLCMADFDLDTLLFEQCSSDEVLEDVIFVKRSDGTYQEFLKENKPEILTIQLSADTSMSVGTAWTRYTIPFNKIATQMGDNLSMTSEGKIKIGKGIKAISINTTMLYGSSLSMIEISARYTRNGATKNICVAYTKGSGDSTYYTLANVYPAFVVLEGDEIEFAITAASSGTVSVQKEGTFLCVQKIV